MVEETEVRLREMKEEEEKRKAEREAKKKEKEASKQGTVYICVNLKSVYLIGSYFCCAKSLNLQYLRCIKQKHYS